MATPTQKKDAPAPVQQVQATPNPNTKLWCSVEHTDPKFTKEFKRGGGFSGTAINPTWLHKQATAQFGPIGKGWGWIIHEERKEPNPDGTVVIWLAKLSVWYSLDGQRHETPHQWGATEFIGKNKYGAFIDEEAPKKTITDAVSKCLSYLGFAADVFMGLYDDNKYVAERRQEFGAGQVPTQQTGGKPNGSDANGKPAADPAYAAWVRNVAEPEIDNLMSTDECNQWVIKHTKTLDKIKTQYGEVGESAYNDLMTKITNRQTRLLAA